MVTTNSPSASSSSVSESERHEVEAVPPQQPGFFGLLVKSVFEPGANPAVVMAMNLSFFFLLITLFGLAFLTDWNKHVLILMGVNLFLWAAMVWFVMEITKVQNNPQNMPLTDPLMRDVPDAPASDETRKDR